MEKLLGFIGIVVIILAVIALYEWALMRIKIRSQRKLRINRRKFLRIINSVEE